MRNELLRLLIKLGAVTNKKARLLYIVAAECHPIELNPTIINNCLEFSIKENDEDSLSKLANLYLKTGDFRKALECTQTISNININENSIKYDRKRELLLLSTCYEYLNDIDNAKKYLLEYSNYFNNEMRYNTEEKIFISKKYTILKSPVHVQRAWRSNSNY